MVYFKEINSFLVFDVSLLVTVGSRQCLDMIGGKIGDGLEHGFVKHRLNCLLKTDPVFLGDNTATSFHKKTNRSYQIQDLQRHDLSAD